MTWSNHWHVPCSVAQVLDQTTEECGNEDEEQDVFDEGGAEMENGEGAKEDEVEEVDSDFAEDLEEDFE